MTTGLLNFVDGTIPEPRIDGPNLSREITAIEGSSTTVSVSARFILTLSWAGLDYATAMWLSWLYEPSVILINTPLTTATDRNGTFAIEPVAGTDYFLLTGVNGDPEPELYMLRWGDNSLYKSLSPYYATQSNQAEIVNIELNTQFIGCDPSTSLLYYTRAGGSDKIMRCTYAGASSTDLITGLDDPYGIAVDVSAGKIYWVEAGATNKLKMANLDGSSATDLVTGLSTPRGVALSASYVFVANSGTGKVIRYDKLTGANALDVMTGLGSANGVCVNTTTGIVYATDPTATNIIQATTAGASQANLTGGTGISGLAGIAIDTTRNILFYAGGGGLVRRDLAGTTTTSIVTGQTIRGVVWSIDASLLEKVFYFESTNNDVRVIGPDGDSKRRFYVTPDVTAYTAALTGEAYASRLMFFKPTSSSISLPSPTQMYSFTVTMECKSDKVAVGGTEEDI